MAFRSDTLTDGAKRKRSLKRRARRRREAEVARVSLLVIRVSVALSRGGGRGSHRFDDVANHGVDETLIVALRHDADDGLGA